MATKHANVVTLSEGLPPINLQNPLNIAHVRSRDKSKLLYLHYHSAYVHKTDRVVTYSGELQPIYLHDPSMRWSCKVQWSIRYIIYLLEGDLWILT